MIWIVLGVLPMVAVMAIDYRKLRDLALVGYVGHDVPARSRCSSPASARSPKGSQAWFQLRRFPAPAVGVHEVLPDPRCSPAYCYLHRNDFGVPALVGRGRDLRVCRSALVMLQPDLGTALVLGAISFAMLAVGGVKGRYLAVLALVVVTGVDRARSTSAC